MTAAIHRSTPSFSAPQTQNTAPVLEFACLYTHDLRKKAKKWNDGFLRYHTFNKRVMLYDIPRNYIGDQHWTGEEALQEGDEVLLEKVGVKVDVAERTGETETDLSELRAKKTPASNVESWKRVDRRQFGTAALPVVRASNGGVARGNTQPKHRSLNALLGTPKGVIGKAVLPTKSPYEERHVNEENEEWEGGRLAKRPRVTGKKTPSKRADQDSAPLWARTANEKANQQQQAGDEIFIDLCDDVTPLNDVPPGLSSDALASSSPARGAARRISGSSTSPAFQARQTPAAPAPPLSRQRTGKPRIQESAHGIADSAISTTNGHVQQPAQPSKSPQLARQTSPRPLRSLSTKPCQTLRLAASAPKKKMLLCQDQLMRKPPKTSSTVEGIVAVDSLTTPLIDDDRPKTAKERVQQRMESIRRRRNADVMSSAALKRVDTTVGSQETLVGAEIAGRKTEQRSAPHDHDRDQLASALAEPLNNSEESNQRSPHQVSAIELAHLDRIVLPPEAPYSGPTSPVAIPSPREDRRMRRVISDPINKPNPETLPDQSKMVPKRAPGAHVHYTPTSSPTRQSREATSVPLNQKEARASFKSKPKKNLQKSVSLNVASAGTSTVILGRPFQAPGKSLPASVMKPNPPLQDVGPWSREAFDLFKWRPPGWDEEKWCVGGDKTTV